jgi:hypothetical protein
LCPLIFTLAVTFKGNGIGAYKVPVDLNVEADAPAEDDEDDIDWEEG